MLIYIPLFILFFYYVFIRLTLGITRSAKCLIGKTAIVTGGNSGMGYQVALNLASRGCRVIIADVADAEESKRNIIKFTHNPNIIAKKLNLLSFNSIRKFADDILKTESRLDILINNAGVAGLDFNRSEDGLHPVMQINYFGHFLLTHLLIDLLKKSAPSRIVFTSSFMAFFNTLTVENLNFDDEDLTENVQVYSNSKFAVILAADYFARKLKNTGVTSNSVHPGVVNTTLLHKYYSVEKKTIVFIIAKSLSLLYFYFFSKDPWEGSQTTVHVAVSHRLEKVTGEHFWECRRFLKPRSAHNRKYCRNIIKASEDFVKLTSEERL